jgi:chromosome segregation ATPase
MTQQTEHNALRKLAEAATPGPWAFGTFHRLLVVQADKHGGADKHSAIADIGAGSIPWDATAESMQEYNDAEYIAAANPAKVITLLDQLQSQAEHIKETERTLDKQCQASKLVIDDLRAQIAAMTANTATDKHLVDLANDTATRLLKERDTLRAELADAELHTKQVERGLDKATAQLAEIEKTEPVSLATDQTDEFGEVIYREVFARPMPAQDVTELVELLEFMWREVSMNEYAFEKLEAALSKYKGGKA